MKEDAASGRDPILRQNRAREAEGNEPHTFMYDGNESSMRSG